MENATLKGCRLTLTSGTLNYYDKKFRQTVPYNFFLLYNIEIHIYVQILFHAIAIHVFWKTTIAISMSTL
jgi:hypothetical protein